jgi:hypothetical protein
MKKHPYTPNLETLAKIISGRDEAWRAKLRAASRKGVAVRKANREAKAKAKRSWAPVSGRGSDAGKRRLEAPGWQMLARRMEPGLWYGAVELRGLMPEYAVKSVRTWTLRAWREGLIERAPNPDFDQGRAPGRQSEPTWLYRSSG